MKLLKKPLSLFKNHKIQLGISFVLGGVFFFSCLFLFALYMVSKKEGIDVENPETPTSDNQIYLESAKGGKNIKDTTKSDDIYYSFDIPQTLKTIQYESQFDFLAQHKKKIKLNSQEKKIINYNTTYGDLRNFLERSSYIDRRHMALFSERVFLSGENDEVVHPNFNEHYFIATTYIGTGVNSTAVFDLRAREFLGFAPTVGVVTSNISDNVLIESFFVKYAQPNRYWSFNDGVFAQQVFDTSHIKTYGQIHDDLRKSSNYPNLQQAMEQYIKDVVLSFEHAVVNHDLFYHVGSLGLEDNFIYSYKTNEVIYSSLDLETTFQIKNQHPYALPYLQGCSLDKWQPVHIYIDENNNLIDQQLKDREDYEFYCKTRDSN